MHLSCVLLFPFSALLLLPTVSRGRDVLDHISAYSAEPASWKTSFGSSNRDIMDKSSFIAAYRAKTYAEMAGEVSRTMDGTNAIEALRLLLHAYSLYPHVSTRRNITRIVLQISRDERLESTFGSITLKNSLNDWMEMDDLAFEELLLVALELHYDKNYARAITIYEYITDSGKYKKFHQPKYKSELHFNYGSCLQHYGDFNGANLQFLEAVSYDRFNFRAALNLASIHHKYGDPADTTRYYMEVINLLNFRNLSVSWELESMLHTNYGIHLLQSYKYDEAIAEFSKTIEKVETLVELNCKDVNTEHVNNVNIGGTRKLCDDLEITKSYTMHKVYTVHRGSVYWKGWELMLATLLKDTVRFAIGYIQNWKSVNEKRDKVEYSSADIGRHRSMKTFDGPFLPFDTLQVDMSLAERMLIADTYALNYYRTTTFTHKKRQSSHSDQIPSLKVGFLSYDFKEHPTARMLEGLFIRNFPSINSTSFSALRNHVSTTILSYSNQDGSDMSEICKNMSDVYVDLAALSRSEATAEIRRLNLDILIDLQLFTLGNRVEMIIHRPVPIQISYLIFPGTSGASFIDSIVADRIVIPPEHARSYTEKILMMPTSYQISYYDRYSHLVDGILGDDSAKSMKFQLREDNGLPLDPDAIVLCNFNKIDKLDPKVYHIWMNIMSRVPKSYLWLMKSRDGQDGLDEQQILKNLMRITKYHGISIDRIIFASRTQKAAHIVRHYAADLFVDTLIYGAHSTATDALRGGLPIITVNGGSFPNRVVASLYDSFLAEKLHSLDSPLNMLICDSVKEYEDLAVRLLSTKKSVLATIQDELLEHIRNRAGIFDVEKTNVNFIKGMMTSHEIRWSVHANDQNFLTKNILFKERMIHLNNSFSMSRRVEKVNSSSIKYHIVIT